MTVIVICEGLAGGGAVANVAWQQAIGLSRHQPVCVISDGLSPERQQQLNGSQAQLRLILLPIPGFTGLRRFAHLPRQLLWILMASWATRRELRGARTVVICHSHPMAFALAGLLGERLRLVLVSHGDIFHRPPGSYDPAITWLYRRTTAVAHRRAARSVALAPVMLERIQAHGVPSDRIVLLPNGLDPLEIGLDEAIAVPADHWQQRPLRLLFVGRLDPVKGVDVLLRAVALARQAGLEVRLSLIGEGTPLLRRQLDVLSQRLDLSQLIRWYGSQPRSNLAHHYLESHVVVVPSLDDPLPTVILEAMACGRPVLGSEVGGIDFLVRNGVSGLLVAPGQPQALADALLALDRDRVATAALGRRSLELSHQFSWEANVAGLQRVIDSIVVDDTNG